VPATGEHISWIEADSGAFAEALDAVPLDVRVPGCPDWSLRDLARHLGRVQRFWAGVVRVGADTEPNFTAEQPTPKDDFGIASWMRESTADLVDALRTTPADTPAWVWWRDNRTVGAIARHQVQEAAVHRWDAQSAAGAPEPIASEAADDGIAEFVWLARQLRDPAPITFVATDSGRSFRVSDSEPVVTVSASASDLVLCCYRRIPVAAVTVDGDAAVLDAFLQPIG
jgi:uncharacterized protein (TIGR03083 family)